MSLFTPIKVGDHQLKHKVVMAPLTRMRAPGHVPGELNAEYYSQRASRPGTLIITEATFISPEAGGFPNAPGIWSEEQLKGWKKVFDAIHENDSIVFVQLWAMGWQASREGASEDVKLVSASDGDSNGRKIYALTKQEIDEYVDAYVQAARNAIKTGAEGVEIHSANGYLLDQFLHTNSNQRTDEYGGSIENRARFTLRVVDAVSQAIGSQNVGIRFSPWGEFGDMDPEITGTSPVPQFGYIISELQARAAEGNPLAYIHLVEPRVRGVTETDKYDHVKCADLNGFVRAIWDGPIIRAGAMLHHAKQAVEQDDDTLVAFGRYFISNPDIVDRLQKDEPLTKYNRDTFYTPGPVGYTDYPFFDQEKK